MRMKTKVSRIKMKQSLAVKGHPESEKVRDVFISA